MSQILKSNTALTDSERERGEGGGGVGSFPELSATLQRLARQQDWFSHFITSPSSHKGADSEMKSGHVWAERLFILAYWPTYYDGEGVSA